MLQALSAYPNGICSESLISDILRTMDEGFRTLKESKFEIENAAKLGVHLFDKCCCKENAELIKRLLNPIKVEENTEEILKDIKDIRIILIEHLE